MNTSRIGIVFGMEFRRALQRPTLRILLVILFVVVFLVAAVDVVITSGDPSVGGQKAWANSEFNVTVMLASQFSLLYLFFVTIAAGMSIPEDDEANVGPVLHSTPLTAGEYIAGKFLALFAAFALVILAHVVALILSQQVSRIWNPPDVFGPLSLWSYFKPAIVFLLPSLVGLMGVSFLIGTATRRPILVYLFPVFVLLVSVFFRKWSPSWLDPRINSLLMLLDPSGLRWINETWFKTDHGVAVYNNQPVAMNLVFWLNRGFWLVVGIASVLLSWRLFARSLRGGQRVKAAGALSAQRRIAAPSVSSAPQGVSVPMVQPGFFAGLWQVVWMETRLLLRHPAFYLLVPLILFMGIGQMMTGTEYRDVPLLGTPGTFAVSLWDLLTVSMVLLLMFFMVESFERERVSGLGPLFASSPMRTSSILAGKVLANSLVGVVVLLLNFLAAWGVLLYQGTVGMEVMPFALVWGVLLVPTYFVWCAYVMLLQSLFRSRFATYGLALATQGLFGYWEMTGKLTWAGNWMLSGALTWSDMGVLEIDRFAIILNRLLAVSVGILFVVVALRVYARRDRDMTRFVNQLRWRLLLWEALKLAPVLLVVVSLWSVLGIAVMYGTEGSVEENLQRDYWKKNHMTWRDVRVPALVDVDVAVDLDPPDQSFRTEGSFLIKNDDTRLLRRIPLTIGSHFKNLTWTLDGKEYEPKNHAGLCVFTPEKPLAPNETVRIGFKFEGRYPFGISKNRQSADEFILPSGVVLRNMGGSFVPVVGYIDGVGLDAKHRYEPRQYDEDYHLKELQPLWGSSSTFTVRMAVTGPAEYTYNGVGQLVKDVTDGKRRTMVWQSDHPVRWFNIIAGRWQEERGKGVAVHYHSKHRYNVKEVTKALEASREHYSEWFGPYPWKELRLSQFPALDDYAQSIPTNVVFTESMMLMRPDSSGLSAFTIAAHEAAHQWWGHMVTPGKGPGANVLSEGMADYSAMLLLEKVKGSKQRLDFCIYQENGYLKKRNFDAELPLVKLQGGDRPGESVVLYNKGSWAFWMLDQHLGRDRMLAGLRRFVVRYKDNRDHPMIEDLLDILSEQAKDREAFRRLTKQLFFEVHLPEYRLEGVRRTDEDDRSVVRGTVTNKGTGAFTVEVAAVKGKRFGKDGEPNPDYREEKVKVMVESSASSAFTIKAPFTPDRVVIDPDVRVLQMSRASADHAF